ncbi:hypothetical protein UFOVP447_89 [uncultured Caudovirales phage]|uniref:Ig-like domain-containing protein n=1 Tax=uncultured Caudovirales phage TaxID=2100421 RepID=A0A6J5MAK8_9CAUD|nr:hypothetical protein UFOVP447_89 [uncultured Caudovirales phage]
MVQISNTSNDSDIVVVGSRIRLALEDPGPLTVNTSFEDLASLIVIPPLTEGPCRIKRDKKPDENEVKKGSPLAADIREITQTINAETDCVALQQKIKTALNGLKEDIISGNEEIKKKLDEISPILSLPLNVFKIPAWLKKFAIGRILPDLEATIDLILKVVEVVQALTQLIITINDAIPRLEACAIATREQIEADIRNEIERTLREIREDIEDAIAEAICKGLNDAGISADDIDDILTGVTAVINLVDSVDQFKQTIDIALGDSLKKISDNQTLIQDITGIPPVIDATSMDTFIATTSGPAYDEYRAQVQAVLELPEPVNSVLPAITGTAAVGETLTCSNGTWTANGVVNSFAISHQWMRQGQEIFGANTYQYVPVLDDVDYPVYCRVTAENQTNIEQVFSANTQPVVFSMSSGNKPVITGTPTVGQTLTCSEGTWPFTPTSVTYEWVRVIQPGSNVKVQTASSNNIYTVKTGDIGNSIKCKVVAQSFRYTLSIDSANTAVVT